MLAVRYGAINAFGREIAADFSCYDCELGIWKLQIFIRERIIGFLVVMIADGYMEVTNIYERKNYRVLSCYDCGLGI